MISDPDSTLTLTLSQTSLSHSEDAQSPDPSLTLPLTLTLSLILAPLGPTTIEDAQSLTLTPSQGFLLPRGSRRSEKGGREQVMAVGQEEEE